MTLRATRLRRLLGAWCAAVLVTAALAACGAAPVPAREAPTAAFLAASRTHDYRVVDSRASRTLQVVPAHRNGALVVYLHGWSQDRGALVDLPKRAAVTERLAAAGFVVASADAHLKAWGDAASLAVYERLIRETTERYGLRDVFLMGESMGGLATMQLAARLPEVRAVVAWYPVCDLSTMHEARFQATIRAAWRGRSRVAVSPVRVGATPMLVWASPQDTVVDAATNAAVCVREARAAGGRATLFRTTGEHGDPSNFVPGAVLAFFESHRTPGG